MYTLNVDCSKCKKGNLCLPNGYDGLADYYTIHCSNCTEVFTVHYTGMDNILGEHTFNTEQNADVRMLNKNGTFIGQKQNIKTAEFKALTVDMKHMQTIDADMFLHYYQKGTEFFLFVEMPYGGVYDYCQFKAKNDESALDLFKYFFQGVK